MTTEHTLRSAAIALESGALEQARALCAEVLQRSPDHPEALFLLGNALIYSGELAAALSVLEQARAAAPRNPLILNSLGGAYAAKGRSHDAIVVLQEAIEIAPHFPWALQNLGAAFASAGELDAAKRCFLRALDRKPDFVKCLAGLAEIAQKERNWSDLERFARSWLHLDPVNAVAWRFLAKAQSETGYYGQAADSFRIALGQDVASAQDFATLARHCLAALRYDEAESALADAERLDPNDADVLSTIAVLMMFRGRFDEAQSYCRRSLNVAPAGVTAYRVLAQVTRGNISDIELVALKRLCQGGKLRDEDRISATFALADCLDARQEIEGAFSAYEEANSLSRLHSEREGFVFSRAVKARETTELISLLDAAPTRVTREDALPLLVFIVGMPRSGTTLIESVLGAHSKVLACGERGAMRWILSEFLAQGRPLPLTGLPERDRLRWRADFLRELPAHDTASVITDKNPWNFDALPLILELFPSARIIHVRRNPIDTGLSIFRNQFSKFQPFTTRLDDIGYYIGEYTRLMAHWESLLADRLVTIQYETFCATFEQSARALLSTCGLDWEDNCKTFWSVSRTVSTMSAVQARQPLDSINQQSNRYRERVLPLVDALNEARVDPTTGGLKART